MKWIPCTHCLEGKMLLALIYPNIFSVSFLSKYKLEHFFFWTCLYYSDHNCKDSRRCSSLFTFLDSKATKSEVLSDIALSSLCYCNLGLRCCPINKSLILWTQRDLIHYPCSPALFLLIPSQPYFLNEETEFTKWGVNSHIFLSSSPM